ncbi:hypothetical protein ASU33_00010 [Solirubrum puertoriconensis]|uniref:Uncharacterized protein n=1 Tax=Solirubrum puertoriconensis TaxID=1751427 RepID=A0A9X0L2S6_SOLP1|nr:hypothetical protein ASU33_00010 [Solirubrum puertoriconensis]
MVLFLLAERRFRSGRQRYAVFFAWQASRRFFFDPFAAGRLRLKRAAKVGNFPPPASPQLNFFFGAR